MKTVVLQLEDGLREEIDAFHGRILPRVENATLSNLMRALMRVGLKSSPDEIAAVIRKHGVRMGRPAGQPVVPTKRRKYTGAQNGQAK